MSAPNPAPESLSENPGEQYRLLTENVKDFAIFLLDNDGCIASWNSGVERILGYKEAEIIGKPFATFFTRLDVVNSHPDHELETARERGRSEDERWHVRKDGSQFWAMGVVTPLWDEGGQLRGYAKIMRDITDRKRAEMDLAEANHRKDEFLAMLAHELRNPLAPIVNGLELLRRDPGTGPTRDSTIALIERQTNLLTRLVDDLLDVSRITTGKVTLRKQRVDLRTVIANAVEISQPAIDSRQHQLCVSQPEEAVWLDADPTRLQQVLGNVLNNAAKYTEPGGRIGLDAAREGTEVVIRVTDTGIGILADMLPRIFTPFVQADRSLDRSQGGLGIGLTLAKALTEMHGGKIDAHSPGVGHGSEFVIRLPVVPELNSAIPQADSAVAQPKRPPHLRLLVVDDNTDTVETLAMLLRIDGHDVATAQNGPAALERALSQEHDAILMDIGLPGIDGFEVARRIRAHSKRPVLIAMTGYGQPDDQKKSKEAGFDYHLTKPVDPTRLQELLTRIAGPQSVA